VRQATTVLVVSFFVMPVSSTIVAVLQREMDFAALLRINLAGILANSGVSVLLAAQGWGALGLAWASVAGQATLAAVAALHRPHAEHFIPSAQGAARSFASAPSSCWARSCSSSAPTLRA
jgi:O-antigen/teichoic acid export membrane protein